MRVGLVCPYALDAPGGVQNQVLGLASWLLERGHDPFVLAPGRPVGLLDLHGLPVERVATAGRGLPVGFNGSVACVALAPDVPVRVGRWLRAIAPDVVHVHEPLVPLTAPAAVRQSHVPVVGTFHASGQSRGAVRLARCLAPLERLTAVTTVSATAAEQVRSALGISPIVVPNGLRVADFAVAGASPAAEANSRVTFLGRLDEPRKGLSVFLAAVPLIREWAPQTIVTVAGAGNTPLPDWVEAMGPVTDAQRNDLLRRTRVLVAPNTGSESFGLILVEALAAGASVVASDLPAFRDVLAGRTGPVGTSFLRGDAAALARAVVTALSSPDDSGTGRAARQERAREFDWDAVGPAYLAVFADAVRAGSHRTIA